MNILTVNSGSSSVRLVAFRGADESGLEVLASAHEERAAEEREDFLGRFIKQHGLADVSVVAHRVVHGGPSLVEPCYVDEAVEREIERLEPLAPLHNEQALNWIRSCRSHFGPGIPQVAVFDTAFYADLPEAARSYALPRPMTEKYHLRRYGFHGLAHRAIWRRWAQRRGAQAGRSRIISLQLGSGCSVTATRDGTAVDTSMGFSPLEGLVMATRCGDIDAGLITYLQRSEALTPDQTDRMLEKQSGLLGVSGMSSDMRELLADGGEGARRAIELFCYRARKYVGSYLAVLGGADGIVFGGGIGEHAAPVRERILSGMEWCGVALDQVANSAASGERRISSVKSSVDVWVFTVDEARELACGALAVMERR
ncbi:MAG: acetate/propionate family kinase [Acidiferrobacterales bacterium]